MEVDEEEEEEDPVVAHEIVFPEADNKEELESEDDDNVIASISNALASAAETHSDVLNESAGTTITTTTTTQTNKSAETEPNEYDVYMGRGGLMNRFRNGSLYRRLILENFQAYKTATCKRDFAMDNVIIPVQEKGGRFFVPSSNLRGWVQGDIYEVIAPKVMQALRDCYKDEGVKPFVVDLSKTAKTTKKTTVRQKKAKAAQKRASSSSVSTPRKKQATAASKANHPTNKIRQRIFGTPSAATTPLAKMNQFGHPASAGSPNNVTTPLSTSASPFAGLKHNLLLSGSPPAAPTPAASSPSAPSSPPTDPKKRVLLNEKGHMMNTVQRTTGVCGFYHFLLAHHASRFRAVDALEEAQFVWDNIVTPIQKQGGSLMYCPKSGKVQDEVNHKTIIAISNALRDKEYIEEECANPYGKPGSTCGGTPNNGKKHPAPAVSEKSSNEEGGNDDTPVVAPTSSSVATADESPDHSVHKKEDSSVFAVAPKAVIGISKKEESKVMEKAKPTMGDAEMKFVVEAKPVIETKPAVPTAKIRAYGSYNAMKQAAGESSSADLTPNTMAEPAALKSTIFIASTVKGSPAAATTLDAAATPTKETATAPSETPKVTPNASVPNSTESGKNTEAGSNKCSENERNIAEEKVEVPSTRKSSRISTGSITPASINSEPRPTRSNSHITAALTTRPKRQASGAFVAPEQNSTLKNVKPEAVTSAKTQPPKLKRNKSRDSKQGSVDSDKQSKFPWQMRFDELVQYAKKHGNSNVSQRDEDNAPLGRFVKINRQYWMRNRQGGISPLTPEREALLDGIGFVWNMLIDKKYSFTYDWVEQFRALKAFQRKHGHCNVPLVDKTNKLARWVAYMRKLKTVDPKEFEGLGGLYLTSEWEKKLDAIGFSWESCVKGEDDSDCDSEESVTSKGSVKVDKVSVTVPVHAPVRFIKTPSKPSPPAPITVVKKVTADVPKHTVSLPPSQLVKATTPILLPNSVNINPLTGKESNFGNNKNWRQCFAMLKCFKDENGHTQVPYKRFPHNNPVAVLSKFAMTMRSHKALKNRNQPNNLTDEREELLNSIGFEWRTTYECTQEGSKALAQATGQAPPAASRKLTEIARAPRGSSRKELKQEPEIVYKTIIDSEGTKWSTYRPVPVDKLFKPEPQLMVPLRPPTPENWGVEMAYESDGNDSVTF
jgi:hypothetical protein